MCFNGKNAVVIGAKKSGIAAAKLLKKKGYTPFVTEINDSVEIKENVQELEKLNIDYETGFHTIDKFCEADFVVLSPGVQIENFKNMMPENIPILSEIELAFRFLKHKFIAITGSNGKTTTTALTAHILNSAGIKSKAVGNIGDPLSNYADFDGTLVVEISSFQLEHIEKFKPFTAVILNMTPDHLDRYESLDDYYASKARIFENMDEGDNLIYNADCSKTSIYIRSANCRKLTFSVQSDKTNAFLKDEHIFIKGHDGSLKIISKNEISILGIHNIYNSMAALVSGLTVGGKIRELAEGLKDFPGIPHRLEYLGIANGVKYYNDSKSTNVDSLKFALLSFNTPVTLIAGGKDKMVDVTVLNPLIKYKVKNLVLIGQAAERFKKEFELYAGIVHMASSMEDAVFASKRMAMAGEVVLLSPACSSFDMYNNFEERGDDFRNLVKKICFHQ
ncbi:UDP-N-acetylmuramoyl-L-alanine--D-glutamate ligase [candidate division KSB1 bacterium]